MARAKDPARTWTDKELKEMERRISGIYDQAQKEITEKWDAYMERTEKRLGNLYAAYVSAPDNKKADALERYQKALENATYKNKWYREMVTETATRLTRVNEIATAYINGQMPEIYKVNYDQIDPDALIPGIKYTMVDEHTIRNLIKNGTIPQKKVDEDNDASWNTKQIGSSVLQGILQGESIPNIAKRIMPIVDRNEASAVRNARTMTTAAENRGRLDRYSDYESKGLIMQKVWIATGDDRTRDWHLSLDGEEVDKDEPFIDGHGNELMYPGDPDARAETVWNCRCSMRSHITGVRGKSGKITPIADMHKKGLHQEQIDKERKRRGVEPKEDVARTSNIVFAKKFEEEKWIDIRSLIESLSDEYNTRLKEVESGAEKSAGDVDITGSRMRLNSTEKSTAMHEFAHTLANTDADKYGLTNDAEFWKEIKKIQRAYKKDVGYDTTRWISSYEHSNSKVDEFFAESFAHAKLRELGFDIPSKYGSDFTYSQKVLDVIDKYFKKRR